MTTILALTEIQKITKDVKAQKGLQSIVTSLANVQQAVGANIDATSGIGNATVVTLSPNDAFANERVLEVAAPLGISVTDANVIIGFLYDFVINGGFRLTINLQADTNTTLLTGTMVTQESLDLGPFATDAAAATGGISVGQIYRKTDGTTVWRQV